MLTLLSTIALLAAAAPPSKLAISPCDFGEGYQFAKRECVVELRNLGEKPIAITEVRAVKAGDEVTPTATVIAPHGTAYMKTQIDLSNSIGRTKRYFGLRTDEPGQTGRTMEVAGYVASVLDDAKPTLDFGVVQSDKGSVEKTVSLASREAANFAVTKILDKPDYLDAVIGEDNKTVTVKVKPNAPWSLHQNDFVKLSINSPQQREAWILVKSDVHGDVVPDSNPFALGLMRTNGKNEYLIRLTSPSRKPFKVGKVDVSRIDAHADVVPCLPENDACKTIRLRFSDKQQTGEIGGTLTVDLPDLGQKLPVYVWGMLVGPKTEVKNLEDEIRKNEEARKAAAELSGGKSAADGGAGKMNLKEVIGQSIAKSTPVQTPGSGPLLKWSVAHQSPVYGYVIYRAENEEGPYVRVNKETVLAVSDGDNASSYAWRDESAQGGKTYWYYIGTLQRDGSKEKLTSPQKVVARTTN